MKTLLSLTATLLVAACASSPAELVATPPEMVHSSDKTAEAVAKCIDAKWEMTKVFGGTASVETKQTEAGIRITQRTGGDPHFVALVTPRANGSRTQLWKQKVLAIGRIPQVDDVVSCQ